MQVEAPFSAEGTLSLSHSLPPAMAAAPLPPLFFPASDDDEFGDFEFAPPLSLQPITTAAAAPGEEDEWGDFVESPGPGSRPPDLPLWERSRGAIPLSIFGEEEEEPEPAGSDARQSSPAAASSGRDPGLPARPGGRPEAAAIPDLVDGDDSRGEVGGSGAVAAEEWDLDDGGWEFQSAVAGGDALEVAEGEKEILCRNEGHSKQGLVDSDALHNTLAANTFDFFSDIAVAAGCDQQEGLIIGNGFVDMVNGIASLDIKHGEVGLSTGNGFVVNMVNGNSSLDIKHGEVKHAILEAGALDFFQWQEDDGKYNAPTGTQINASTPGGEFQNLGGLWGSHMEDVTVPSFNRDAIVPPSNSEHEDPSCLLDAQNDFFAFQQASTESGSKDKITNIPLVNGVFLNSYEEHRQGSFHFENSCDNGRDPVKEAVHFNNTSLKDDVHDSHMLTANGFLERLENQALECVAIYPVETEPENFVDLYSRLKEVSYFIALDHLVRLKKACELAVLSNEDKDEKLQLQIQVAYAKLEHEHVNYKNITEDDRYVFQDSCNRLLQGLKHVKFQVLEMGNLLSERIKLAYDDLNTAIQLFEHASMILRMLHLNSSQEQRDCSVAWSKIIAVCEKELQHGATILAQSLQSDLCEGILSESKGRNYFLALGEIYRVVEILNITLSVYRPWVISNLAELNDPFLTVSRCKKFWMDAGLREALEDVYARADLELKEEIEIVIESIDLIRNLDATSMQSHITSGLREPICCLSLLPLSMLPDMEVVAWNGRNYFLKLANLWANLVSIDPPELPCMHLVSEDVGNAD